MRLRSSRWMSVGLLGLLGVLWGAPVPAQDVPPPLQGWQAWVLHDVPQHACPFLATRMPGDDSYQCAWPGRLTLDAGASGGRFSLDVHVDASSWVALPGDERNWPQQVMANRQVATVLQRAGQPMLWLTPGDYQLSGNLPWATRPAQLRVPAMIGLVTLSVDGKVVTRVERNGDRLTLGEAAAAQRTTDALSLRVYRHLGDGLPATLQTRLQLDVTGSVREQVLGPVLPAGFVATMVSGDLPARLDGDGRLRVQLRPGQWTIELDARSLQPLRKIALSLPAAPWPRQEIWSYADDTHWRGTRVDGHAVDASQMGVPDDWQALPAYALDNSTGLTITQGARGNEGGQNDQLQVQRQMWLDFDGDGINVVDHLSGTLRHHLRLDVAAPWQLQRAMQDDTPLLVTTGVRGKQGVELRDQDLDLVAGLRLADHAGVIPSSGWDIPLESIHATLHLPYGYRLLGAVGADHSPDSWVASWSLLDLFVAALIALLAGRLLGWPWALLAAGYLVLAQHEHGAPLWTLALAFAFALLLRALPDGRLRSAARACTVAMFVLAVLWTLPFTASQLQYALHPQLESGNLGRAVAVQFVEPPPKIIQQVVPPPQVAEVSANAVAPPPAVAGISDMAAPSPAVREEKPSTVTAGSLSAIDVSKVHRSTSADAASLARYPLRRGVSSGAAQVSQPYASHDIVQAGNGMPHWNEGNNYRLDWSGPVTAQQSTRLVIAPAWLVRGLRVAMIVLLALLLAKLVTALQWPWRVRWPSWRRGAMVGAVLLSFVMLPHPARAQAVPSQQLLNQLRSRLTAPPKCAPNCAALAQAQLKLSGDTLVLDLEAHAGAAVALPLPQAGDGLQLFDVAVDGHASTALARGDNRQWLLRMDAGVHDVSLHYHVGKMDSASLHFVVHPQQVSFSGDGWTLEGVDHGHMQGDSLSLHRVRSASDGKSLLASQSFPPYVRMTRELDLGVDWTVQNTVERIAPTQGGFTVTLPLLPGEHPLGEGLLVKDGRITITFNANSNAVTWSSRLDHTAKLVLKAPPLAERVEEWIINSQPMWHVDAKGVPTSADEVDDRLYQPLPGEQLQLSFSQPAAVAGGSVAFDDAQMISKVGERVTDTTLSLQARSTRGGEHTIDLPAGAELLDASRDDDSLSLAVHAGKLSLPLLPGSHTYVLQLREPHGVAARVSTPAFALHAPVANIQATLQLPHDRWVLWTWGPTVGPAVLYWSQLIVLLLAAWLLARHAPTPLRFHQWLLLGLGFSAFAWSAYVLVVMWLILLGWRARTGVTQRLSVTRFNLLQAALGALTLLALAVLVGAVPKGLLGLPDMHVAGNGSSAWNLRWFADQSANALPAGGVFSVSLWVYKIAMLAWALWLANALIGWLRWAFDAWTRDGYWRKREPKTAATPPPMPEPPTHA